MSKTDDTEKTRELTEDELASVSGGQLLSNVLRMLEDTSKAIIGNIR